MSIATAICAQLFLSARAYAEDRKWETTDTALLTSALAATTIDWGQTRYIAKHPEYSERNPILGSHPSVGKVNAYFGTVILGTIGLSIALPQTQRRIFLGGLTLLETAVVIHNHGIGIRASF